MPKIKLKDISTDPPAKVKKEYAVKELGQLKTRLAEMQNLLYASGKHSMLVIMQGMDASGKDGAIRNVFDTVNP